jgi:hypothetical protein
MSTRKKKFECPHCHGAINDSFIMSWGQTLLSARAKGSTKVRSHEVMARAARIRWEKYWEKKGGRPSWYPPLPLKEQQVNATSPPRNGKRRPDRSVAQIQKSR